MRARIALATAALVVALCAGSVFAAEWGLVNPGTTTQEVVRERYGAPTKVTSAKIEGYDEAKWLYEGDQAPPGLVRMTIEFGLLTAQGFKPNLARVMLLEPRPGVFTRDTILAGWGAPQRYGKEKDADVFFYDAGLLVYFNKEGWLALTLVFTIRQDPAAAAPAPRRP